MALPKLLLFLVVLALVPLILFGVTAYNLSTTSLNNIEHEHVSEALGSAQRAFQNIQANLIRTVSEYASWDDLHDELSSQAPDSSWFDSHFSPSASRSITMLHDLSVVGIRDAHGNQVYGVGPAIDLAVLKDPGDADSPATLISTASSLYVAAFAPVKTSAGNDPNGVLLMAHELGQQDVDEIKALSGYDVALYRNNLLLASTDPSIQAMIRPDELQQASGGLSIMDHQSNVNFGIAYQPLLDGTGTDAATLIVLHPRASINNAQTSIALALAICFTLMTLLALVVAFFLRNAVVKPLSVMANTADKIANGDLSQHVSASLATDELFRLANAFNRMADKVHERIEESEEAKARLQALDEYRLHLINEITESFRRPLNQIESHSQLLCMEVHGALNDAQHRSAAAIRRATNLQEVLLSDLLDFSAVQQKQLRMAFKSLSVMEIVCNVYNTIKEHYADKHIQFVTAIPPHLASVLGDPVRVEQILDRVIAWAFELCIPNGRVQVSALEDDAHVKIWVSDTSRGLSPEDKDKILELFYHPPQKSGKTGPLNGLKTGPLNLRTGPTKVYSTGLGLALVKSLIEQQNGTLDIEVQPGYGNTFILTIPLAV